MRERERERDSESERAKWEFVLPKSEGVRKEEIGEREREGERAMRVQHKRWLAHAIIALLLFSSHLNPFLTSRSPSPLPPSLSLSLLPLSLSLYSLSLSLPRLMPLEPSSCYQ